MAKDSRLTYLVTRLEDVSLERYHFGKGRLSAMQADLLKRYVRSADAVVVPCARVKCHSLRCRHHRLDQTSDIFPARNSGILQSYTLGRSSTVAVDDRIPAPCTALSDQSAYAGLPQSADQLAGM
jgi:hypothetical protein